MKDIKTQHSSRNKDERKLLKNRRQSLRKQLKVVHNYSTEGEDEHNYSEMEQSTPSPPIGTYKKSRGRAYVDTCVFEEHREEVRKTGVVRNKFSESIDNEVTITTSKKTLAGGQSESGTSLKRSSSHQVCFVCVERGWFLRFIE